MFDKKYLYEFDPSGGLAANRITDELHIINPASGSDYDVIIPAFAPFFRKGLVIKHLTSGQTLTEGVHFDLGYHFAAASKECATPIYGAIVITDRTLSGNLSLDYQTLGGEWVLDTQEIQTILANIKTDPRTVKWDDIIDKPITFPPVEHLHHSDDLVGMDDVAKGIDAIREAIGESAAKAMTSLLEHLRDHANPHMVTLQQLGLDALGNLTEATDLDIDQGTDGSRFVSSRRLQHFFTAKVQPEVKKHTDLKNNPHGVTKAQVGLSEVANLRLATLAEALEGSLNNRYMSPQLTEALVMDRIRAAIDGGGPGGQVTKESIGLGKVENYPPSTFEQAIAGTHEQSVMTPLRVAQHVSNVIAAAIQAHVDAPNPHKITAKTVGLENVMNYGIATAQELIDGTTNTKYVTVAGVAAMMGSSSGSVQANLDKHIKDKANPHGTTKSHVGLSNVENYRPSQPSDVVVGNQTTYLTPYALLTALWDRLTERVMASGKKGDIPYVSGNANTGGYTYGRIIQRDLGIATNTAELEKLKDTKEDFSQVFKNWRRFSLWSTLVNPAKQAELDGWKFNSNSNTIESTINSETNIGFVSPETFSDYTFEVNVRSADTDDDGIGIVLGYYTEGGETFTLMAQRTCGGTNGGSGRRLWRVSVNMGTSKARDIYHGNGGLKWPDTGTVDDNRNPDKDIGSPGWSKFPNGVNIRAIRKGDIITVETSDYQSPGTYVATSKVTIDLNSNPDLAGFKGSSPIGYCAFSQPKATFVTRTRPNQRVPIYDMSSGQVIEYDGNTWVPVEDPADYLEEGRIFHTAATGKTHFVEDENNIVLIAELTPAFKVHVVDSPTIKFTGDGTEANPLKAELTGVTPEAFHSDVDITAGK